MYVPISYSLGDVSAKQWRIKGYKAHHNLSKLLRGVNCDIVIFAFNLQSFPSVCRQIIDSITPQTVAINANLSGVECEHSISDICGSL